MLKDITFGQYFESNSVIHRIDPRVKIVLMIVAIVFIFVSQNWFSLLFSTAFVLFTIIVSKVPLKMYLKNMKATITKDSLILEIQPLVLIQWYRNDYWIRCRRSIYRMQNMLTKL